MRRATQDVARVEEQFGFSFPPDYIEMCQRYGRGTFTSSCTGVSLVLPNQEYLHHLETTQIRLPPRRQRYSPHEAYPSTPGFIPWAWDEGDAEVYWLVDDRPSNQWPIFTREGERYEPEGYECFEMTATEFLAGAFSHQINVQLWNPANFATSEAELEAFRKERVRFIPR